MKTTVFSVILCVAVWLPQPGGSLKWTNFVRDRVNRDNVVSRFDCQMLTHSGSCLAYDCYNELERTCMRRGEWLMHTMEIWCFNSLFLGVQGNFSIKAVDYLRDVRRCQDLGMLNTEYLGDDCVQLNKEVLNTLTGPEGNEVDISDCFWQFNRFCEIIKNPCDNAALVESIYGDSNDGGLYRVKQAQAKHLRYLAGHCPQDAQDIFNKSFVPLLPPGTEP